MSWSGTRDYFSFQCKVSHVLYCPNLSCKYLFFIFFYKFYRLNMSTSGLDVLVVEEISMCLDFTESSVTTVAPKLRIDTST